MTTASQNVPVVQASQMEAARAERRKRNTGNAFRQSLKYIVLLALAFTWAFPLFWTVSSALKDDPQIYTVPPVWIPSPMHWENFYDGWTRYDFNRAAFNSIFLYSLPVTIFTLISCTLVAYGFSRIKWRGREGLFWVCIATMMLPWQVTMVPLFITYKNLGWINTYLPLVVPSMFGTAYFIFLLRQFFMTIPEELSDAARIDGASELGILWRVIVPLSTPVLAVVALFRFLWSWNDYLGPLIYLNQEQLYPIALGIERLRKTATGMGNTAMAYPHLMAVSTLVALPIIIIFFLAQRTFVEGITTTGLKG
ncbi:MAG: carbohydrate ABC transporter permease [Caldilineaceae bacterium]